VTVAGAAITSNFGVARPITISGTVFKDTNADGFHDTTEAGLAGWKVYLDLNNNGVLDSTDIVATSDATGKFSFTGIKPGTVVIRDVLAGGYKSTAPAGGAVTLALFSGYAITAVDFGNKQ
jgi:hypothetical protein